jgi:hypothetical protein
MLAEADDTENRPDARQAAREYIRRGYAVTDAPRGSKAPTRSGWQRAQLTADDIDPDRNVGLLLGLPSGGLVDVDLDAPEAVVAAPYLLPETPMRHGRASKPVSHWWYVLDDDMSTVRYRDPDGSTLIELRSTGGQTIVPPSVHPSDELIEWAEYGEPTRVDAEALRRAVAMVASAAVLARRWPSGSRHDAALALAGVLRRGGMPLQDAERLLEVVARVAGDAEWSDRVRAVRDTYAESGPTTGGARLAELLRDGPAVCARLREWLGLATVPVTTQSAGAEPRA